MLDLLYSTNHIYLLEFQIYRHLSFDHQLQSLFQIQKIYPQVIQKYTNFRLISGSIIYLQKLLAFINYNYNFNLLT